MGEDREEDFMNELKREFKTTVSRNMKDMPSLYKEQKFEDIARIAHDIKGTAGLFAMEKGGEIAMRLQRAAEGKESGAVATLIEELISYMREAGMLDS